MTDALPEDLGESLRRSDPDRWLASRFIAQEATREAVTALYAFNHELVRASEVSEPLLAEIRLTWWSEALDEIFEDRPVRVHPVALALKAARAQLQRPLLQTLIEARIGALGAEPFADEGALLAYLDATAGALMQQAMLLLGVDAGLQFVQAAGRAWGLAGLARAKALGREARLPPGFEPSRLAGLTTQTLRAARAALRPLPVGAFPAVAYLCLAQSYARGRAPSLLEKQLRLVWAAATGRV